MDLIVFESDSDNDDYDDDEEDYKQMVTANLSNVELNIQLTTALELIVNENDRASHLIKLSNLLLSFSTKLEDKQLKNALETIGTNFAYNDYKVSTGIELELHLRTYILALEAYGRRLVKMEKELCESLHENLTKLYDVHQHYTKILDKGLQSTMFLSAVSEESVKVQNYNTDFFLMHLYGTLHAMDVDKIAWLEIVNQLKALFAALIEALPGMTGIMTTVETPIDNRATIKIYNNIQKTLQSKFSAGHWYKEWRYLYTFYQAFVEWSATPIHKNLVGKGELMLIKDLWRFGDQEWNKAVSAKSEGDGYCERRFDQVISAVLR